MFGTDEVYRMTGIPNSKSCISADEEGDGGCQVRSKLESLRVCGYNTLYQRRSLCYTRLGLNPEYFKFNSIYLTIF